MKENNEEEERIAKWRAERAAVAEQQKQERLAKKENEVTEDEAERVAKWRVERAAVAEKEKQERLNQKNQQDEEKEKLLEEQAVKTIPTTTELSNRRDKFLRKRRRRENFSIVSFLLIVLLPTIGVIFYLHSYATPLYSAKFVISVTTQQGDDTLPALGGIAGLAGASGNSDVHSALTYLQSEEILTLVEAENQTITRLSSDDVDTFYRLRDWPLLNSSKLSGASFFIKSSLDSSSGLITVEVKDTKPEYARETCVLLNTIVTKKIEDLSDELYSKRLSNIDESVSIARLALRKAQQRVTQLQVESGLQNPSETLALTYALIREMEVDALKLKNELQRHGVDDINSPLVRNLKRQEKELNNRIIAKRKELVSKDGKSGVNYYFSEFTDANMEVAISSQILDRALLSQSSVKKEASLGRSMVQVIVNPQVSKVPQHPSLIKKSFFALVFFYFIYLALKLFKKETV